MITHKKTYIYTKWIVIFTFLLFCVTACQSVTEIDVSDAGDIGEVEAEPTESITPSEEPISSESDRDSTESSDQIEATAEPTVVVEPTIEPTPIESIVEEREDEQDTLEADPTEIATEPTSPTRINIAYGNLPTTLDPHRTSDQFSATALRHLCQGLVSIGDEHSGQSELATSWEYSDDQTILTFNLRQDVRFFDGTVFNADAVIYSFERIQDSAGIDSPLHEPLQGVKIEAPDAYTIVFTLPDPQGDFVNLLGSEYATIISPLQPEEEIAEGPICTGPYFVSDWQKDEFIIFAKNDLFNSPNIFYENQGPALIDEIKFHLMETHEERFQSLLDGVIDTNHLNTQDELNLIKSRGDEFTVSKGHWVGGITYLGFNGFEMSRSVLSELPIRQAIAHAIDKQGLIDAYLAEEFAIPVASLMSPRVIGYSEDLSPFEHQFNLEESRQLLVEAGYADDDGDGIVERNGEALQLTLLTTTDNIYWDMASFIKSQLAEIGIDIEIQQATRAEISEITPTGEFDLLLYDYNWPFPSALQFFLSTQRIGGSNRVGYSNVAVDALIDEISILDIEEEGDLPFVEQKMFEAQQIILQDVAWQPILGRRVVSGVNARIKNLKVHQDGAFLWHDAYIEE